MIKLQIWDTAGQERFQTITTSYYHNANGVAVVYDVTNRESFDSVARWFRDVDNLASPDVCKILIGNKTDLFGSRVVTQKEGSELARSLGVGFLETSAKTSENVGEMFITLARFIKDQMYGKKLAALHTNEIKLENGKKIGEESSSWCNC